MKAAAEPQSILHAVEAVSKVIDQDFNSHPRSEMFVEQKQKWKLSPFRGDNKSKRINNMPLLRSYNYF